MSDGKKAAYEGAQEENWNRRLQVVVRTSPDELLKIFDDLKAAADVLNSDNMRLLWVEHIRIKQMKALIEKLP
jgi:hypothetical protein